MTTYTLEPLDYDGSFGLDWFVTKEQLGGLYAPYVKIFYMADSLHNEDAITRLDELMTDGTIEPGDTVMGFSLGTQNVMSYLHRHTPTPGVNFILIGCTILRNQRYLDNPSFGGVPWDIENDVTCIAREYDGYSDFPTRQCVPGYNEASDNENDGKNGPYPNLHHYVHARLGHASNVVTWRGNIKFELVPTQTLPGGRSESLRDEIDSAYERPVPSASQRAAATDVQVDPGYGAYIDEQTPGDQI